MAYLDGDIVEVGDRVHHITLGVGVVETVNGDDARVRMSRGGGTLNMNGNGFIRGQKVFYWSDPVLLIPKKNQKMLLDKASVLLDQTLQLVQDRRYKLLSGDNNESD